jgi:RNA polymerase sigma-70 factor (ECF subfamily)
MAKLDPQALVRHLDDLHRAAWALCGSPIDADDLVQDLCARILAKPRRVSGDERAYLMRALHNTYLTSRRTASRRPRADVDIELVATADQRVDRRPDTAFETNEVFGAIAQLADDFRLALVAVDIAGLSYAEAADVLGTREATVASRLFRARDQVARTLREVPAPARSVK